MHDGVSCPNCGGWLLRVNSDDEHMTCDTCTVELIDGTLYYRDIQTDELVKIPEDIRLRMNAGEIFELSSEEEESQ